MSLMGLTLRLNQIETDQNLTTQSFLTNAYKRMLGQHYYCLIFQLLLTPVILNVGHLTSNKARLFAT